MNWFDSLIDFFVKNCRTRTVDVPTLDKAIVNYDGNGNETVYVKQEHERGAKFIVASVRDFLAFVTDIPKRMPALLQEFRDVLVFVDDKDIPNAIMLSLTSINPLDAFVKFTLETHEDFMRWFSGNWMTQTEFKRMLIELADQHDQKDLAAIMNYIEFKTEIAFESSAETERSYVLSYKEDDAKTGVKIPKIINVKTPVVSGAAYIADVAFDILIKRPRVDDQTIKFALSPAGKSAVKIIRDARTVIVEEELLKPILPILEKNGVEAVFPLYVRENVEPTQYDKAVYKKIK